MFFEMELEIFANVTGLFVALIITMFCSVTTQTSMMYWTDFEYSGFDNINCSLVATNIKLRRFNKTSYAFSGTVEIKSEMTNDWEMEYIIQYSAIGNNQFVKLPYKFPRNDLCTFLDGPYTEGAKNLAEFSDFPEPQKNVSLCTLYKKGNYTVKDLTFTGNPFMKFFQRGYYKAQVIYYKKNSDESAFYAVNVRLY